MSNQIEFQDEAMRRAEAVQSARALVAEDELLSKDAMTTAMLESGFVDKKGRIYDPGNWISDRKDDLIKTTSSEVQAEAARLKELREEDLRNKHSKTWQDNEQNQ